MSVARSEVRPREVSEAAFLREHPEYAGTAVLDELRRDDFARLDRGGHVYLDYTGGGLYAQSQLREHMRLLESGVFAIAPHAEQQSRAKKQLLRAGHAPGRRR